MMQNNHKHNNRPVVRSSAETNKQDCCKCGCQEGKECCCKASSSVGNGLLVLAGTLLVALSVVSLSCKLDDVANNINKLAKPQAVAEKVQAQPATAVDNKVLEDFVKNNPKLIIDTLNEFYRKQQAAEEEARPTTADKDLIDAILKDKTNHFLGNPKGSFVMIEFFDYNCGYCKMMNKKMAETIKKSKNIRWVLMDAPIFGPRSEIIAQYAFAAAKQGKFAEFHAALGEADKKDEDALKEIGKKLGLNVDKLAKDANSDAAKNKLAENRKYIEKLKINGVPVFIVNGDIRVGAFSDEQMEEYIKQANGGK